VPEPRLLVYSSLFPSSVRPGAGLFIRERMFRVGRELPLTVVSPQPWFPGQGLVRLWRSHYRPMPGERENQDGIEVYYPRFPSVPGLLRTLDGGSMALASFPLLARLRREPGFDLIDAHFAYPDGYAATLLGRRLGVPVTITLRGTELPLSQDPARRRRMMLALRRARHVFSVSRSLKDHVTRLGADPSKIEVVGNGVDTDRFRPLPREAVRQELGLAPDARVLISVGALVERKGFHRVIELLPALRRQFPNLIYLIVGGASPEGDWRQRLERQVADLSLTHAVRFLGPVAPDALKVPLSAADVFVLATGNEGWANVFLEAMACGLPVVTTDVGGNAEVVGSSSIGVVVPFARPVALRDAIDDALRRRWDAGLIRAYAEANSWDSRVSILCARFRQLAQAGESGARSVSPAGSGT